MEGCVCKTAVHLPLTLIQIQIQIQNTLLSVAIITIKRIFVVVDFFARTSSATLTI